MAKANEVATKAVETPVVAAETESTEVASSTTNLVPLLDKDKVRAIKAALGGDRVFLMTTTINDESGKPVTKTAYQQAEDLLTKAAAATESFYGLDVLSREGLEESPLIVVATVGVRDKVKSINGYKAIVAFSQPSVQDFLESQDVDAINFVAKLIQREATDVQFSGLRQAETLAQMEQAINGVPLDISGIVTTSRESGGGLDTEAFDNMWQAFRQGFLKEKAPALAEMLPQKPEVIKCIRSASYANANPNTKPIEERDFFVRIAKAMIQLAPSFKSKDGKPDPQDASVIQGWLDERATLNLTYKATVTPDSDALAKIDF